jgi:signal transduction histidine kinase
VAFRWRIRHKLMVGLGLVVAVILLVLGGTLYGMAKLRATTKGIESKLAELKEAGQFKDAIKTVAAQMDGWSSGSDDRAKLARSVQMARTALAAYEVKLQDTIAHGRDPNQGFQESGLVQALRDSLNKLEAELAAAPRQATAEPNSASGVEDPRLAEIRKSVADLGGDTDELLNEINTNLADRTHESRDTVRTSVWIVSATSLSGVLLLSVLLHFFYGWVFSPIRALEIGAGRLAQGDFEHHIEVHSGDEMEDLAHAFNDMTGRLREMYGDLARQVNERSRQLVRSERLAGVGFLAAGVAHEINNPLASIAFCSEALENRLRSVLARAPGDSEVITKYLRMIQEEAFRCKAITQRLLEFSRGGERRREPTDLVDLVQGVLDMVQHLQNCKGKRIVFEPASRLVAWVNAQEIKSVVLNLVVNALDSMEDGGVLNIRLAEREHMAELVFADTGCGMPPEVLENIFEPFFTRSRTGKGTGLGLSISHRVISQHGGDIEAASAGPNQGSTFTVRLPMQPAEPAKEETFGHAAA